MGLFDKALGFIDDLPIVGDILGGITGHASAKSLQDDQQSFNNMMFNQEVAHAKDMFKLESDFTSNMAEKQYDRQLELLKNSPMLQMQGLKSAGLNPILAATGGFKSPAGAGLSIPIARASTARGSGSGVSSAAKLTIGQTNLLKAQANQSNAQAELTRAQIPNVPKTGDKLTAEAEKARAEVDRAKAEARYKNASTEGVLMDNVKRANLANVYDDAFGQFLTYVKEIGIDRALVLGAILLGPAALARFLIGKVGAKHIPKIQALGNRFWRAGPAREFIDTINKLRKK
jgi:hypothetical protein